MASSINNWTELKQQVCDKELCCLCGTCIGICPSHTLEYVNGEIVNTRDKCVNCGQCGKVCPGKEFDYPTQNKRIFNASPKETDYDLGYYLKIMRGFTNDAFIHGHAASGGLVTELSCFLLEKKYVDYVIGVTGDVNGYSVRALQTREEVFCAMQSKYVFIPVNEIIRFILEHEGKYLYVALPCQIQGMRKAAEINHVLNDRIFLYAGIFCGFNMTQDATDFLIKKSGINKGDINSLEYRGSKEGKNGFRIQSAEKEFFISKHGYTVLNAFYSKERCWKCFDLTGEFADISFGDAWEMEGGWSRIILRTPKAVDIMNEMISQGRVTVETSGKEDIFSSQKKIITYKKRDISVRINHLKDFPDYHVEVSKLSGLKRVKAKLFLDFLKFGKTKMARRMLDIMPIGLLEKLSEFARGDNLLEVFRYGFWGVVTVLVSFISYWLLIRLGMDYKIANIFSVVLTKTTAYLTNKHFVFHSKCRSWIELCKEILMFILTRGLSGVVEFVGLIILVDFCSMDELIGKVLLIVITTILNYFFGKLVVYKKKISPEQIQ